jgi:hypothetical protein
MRIVIGSPPYDLTLNYHAEPERVKVGLAPRLPARQRIGTCGAARRSNRRRRSMRSGSPQNGRTDMRRLALLLGALALMGLLGVLFGAGAAFPADGKPAAPAGAQAGSSCRVGLDAEQGIGKRTWPQAECRLPDGAGAVPSPATQAPAPGARKPDAPPGPPPVGEVGPGMGAFGPRVEEVGPGMGGFGPRVGEFGAGTRR